MNKVKVVDQNAIIKLEVGTGFLQKLQQVMLYLANQFNDDNLDQYKKCIETKEPFPEEFMDHILTVSTLVREIEVKAEEQGFIKEMDLDNIIPQDSQPADQSQLQPE